jgi:hypothetical protein
VLEVAFVLAPRQNLFFVELQRALAVELERQEIRASLHVGAFPQPRKGLVYALLPPHEYFTLMHGRAGPSADVFARTMFVCTEQPGTSFFRWNVEVAPKAGALFDINRLAIRAYRELGLAAHQLQLGYTQSWDHMPELRGGSERDIDVLFIGAASGRRLRYLGGYGRTLRNRRCQFVISDNSRPNWKTSGTFLSEAHKWELLGRSKVLINLHQGETPYFEWLRVVQAMSNGCVVVSEASLGSEPLVAGEHLLAGRAESLAHLAEKLLDDYVRRRSIQEAAYRFLHDELTLEKGVRVMAREAHRLDECPVPSPMQPFFLQPPPRQKDSDAAIARLEEAPASANDPTRRVLKDLRLGMLDLRRRIDRLEANRHGGPLPSVVLHGHTRNWIGARPKVTVLVTVYNYARHVREALDSLLASRERAWEAVIVDDGSSDDSTTTVLRWIRDHDGVPALFLRHPVNRGLAHARNAAIQFARGEYCFVLDADNAIEPWCFERLVPALDEDHDAAFAYGMLERFSGSGTVGLGNIYPWDAGRFREQGGYIDAMALIRTSLLREMAGYRSDPRLYGWEDFDLWVRMAERGLHAIHVPSIVARYRVAEHSMLSITNISAADAMSLIADASPKVMAGARIPD